VVITQADRPSSLNREASGLEALGVPPGGGPLYDLAFTHRSYAYERPEPGPHNERLEFLGGAILGAIVTGLIFDRYPSLAEGEMARLRSSVVNTIALADLARSLGVGAHIRLGKGEEASGGRDKPSLLADTFEALVGAAWLDRGMEEVRRALEPVFERRLSAHLAAGERYDVKTALQEVAVRERKAMPHYRVSSSGPDHDKRFRADVLIDDEILGAGVGRSKKEAELNAAREAIRILGSGEAQHRGGAQNGSEATDACAS